MERGENCAACILFAAILEDSEFSKLFGEQTELEKGVRHFIKSVVKHSTSCAFAPGLRGGEVARDGERAGNHNDDGENDDDDDDDDDDDNSDDDNDDDDDDDENANGDDDDVDMDSDREIQHEPANKVITPNKKGATNKSSVPVSKGKISKLTTHKSTPTTAKSSSTAATSSSATAKSPAAPTSTPSQKRSNRFLQRDKLYPALDRDLKAIFKIELNDAISARRNVLELCNSPSKITVSTTPAQDRQAILDCAALDGLKGRVHLLVKFNLGKLLADYSSKNSITDKLTETLRTGNIKINYPNASSCLLFFKTLDLYSAKSVAVCLDWAWRDVLLMLRHKTLEKALKEAGFAKEVPVPSSTPPAPTASMAPASASPALTPSQAESPAPRQTATPRENGSEGAHPSAALSSAQSVADSQSF